MFRLKYYDYWGKKIAIPTHLDKLYVSKKQAWWTHFHKPPISSYYAVDVVEV